ncbi:MAG: DUF6153 family protein [Microbacterium sp.]|jgi:hypothetical protein|nr:DUF6153 family protein [Microbacterium sp.]
MSRTTRRWLRSALPLLVLLTAVGIIGMHALGSGHGSHGTSPVAMVHAAGTQVADTESVGSSALHADARSADADGHRTVGAVDTPTSHPRGGTDCVPALLGVSAPVSAPATPIAIVPPPTYRTGIELSARAIAPPRPSLILLSISRT